MDAARRSLLFESDKLRMMRVGSSSSVSLVREQFVDLSKGELLVTAEREEQDHRLRVSFLFRT